MHTVISGFSELAERDWSAAANTRCFSLIDPNSIDPQLQLLRFVDAATEQYVELSSLFEYLVLYAIVAKDRQALQTRKSRKGSFVE
jgi:hypothetical protein